MSDINLTFELVNFDKDTIRKWVEQTLNAANLVSSLLPNQTVKAVVAWLNDRWVANSELLLTFVDSLIQLIQASKAKLAEWVG